MNWAFSPLFERNDQQEFTMNAFANIWNHPRTSAAGLLIGIAGIGSVLAQQGITLGKAGTGTVVSLVTGIATVLLGLFAKDPTAKPAGEKAASLQGRNVAA
jgi:drug/metabolite transporter (DMT)-like permease